jgi:protein-disulfide isomerase
MPQTYVENRTALRRNGALAVVLLFVALVGVSARADDVRLITHDAQTQVLTGLKTLSAGGQHADVTIVEWFDYDCPFCRKMQPDLQRLLLADAKVRVIYKEWPIFGEVSEYAAHSALAANWQGKYLTAHDALISTPDAIADTPHVDATLTAAGIDMARLRRDRTAHADEITAILARSTEEAQRLGFKGTPALLIGRQFVTRTPDYLQLQKLTADARASDAAK